MTITFDDDDDGDSSCVDCNDFRKEYADSELNCDGRCASCAAAFVCDDCGIPFLEDDLDYNALCLGCRSNQDDDADEDDFF